MVRENGSFIMRFGEVKISVIFFLIKSIAIRTFKLPCFL